MRLSYLERAVLEKLLAGDHPFLEGLRRQLPMCSVQTRRFYDTGFMTELAVDKSVEPAEPRRSPRISDVIADLEGLDEGAGFVLFVEGGVLDALEGFSYDEPWPSSLGKFELKYIKSPRDLSGPECLPHPCPPA